MMDRIRPADHTHQRETDLDHPYELIKWNQLESQEHLTYKVQDTSILEKFTNKLKINMWNTKEVSYQISLI